MADEVASELPGFIPMSAEDDDRIWLMPPPQYGGAEQAQRGLLVGPDEAMQSLNRTLDLSDRLTCVMVTRSGRKHHLGRVERGYDGYSQYAAAEFV